MSRLRAAGSPTPGRVGRDAHAGQRSRGSAADNAASTARSARTRSRTGDLAAQHAHLMAPYQDLDVLARIRAGTQHQQFEQSVCQADTPARRSRRASCPIRPTRQLSSALQVIPPGPRFSAFTGSTRGRMRLSRCGRMVRAPDQLWARDRTAVRAASTSAGELTTLGANRT